MAVVHFFDTGVAKNSAELAEKRAVQHKHPRKADGVATDEQVLIKDTPLGAVAGVFKDNPLWDEMMTFVEEARKQEQDAE